MNLITMTFDANDIENSEHWLIKDMWKFLQEDWLELKGKEIEHITRENLQEVMDLIIKYYVFSHK